MERPILILFKMRELKNRTVKKPKELSTKPKKRAYERGENTAAHAMMSGQIHYGPDS